MFTRSIHRKAKNILQELGFNLAYEDTDFVFLKKNGASLEDFEFVKDAFEREAGLPISMEHHHKFLVLLPLEADEKMEALRHYFGITQANELIVGGIGIKRHEG